MGGGSRRSNKNNKQILLADFVSSEKNAAKTANNSNGVANAAGPASASASAGSNAETAPASGAASAHVAIDCNWMEHVKSVPKYSAEVYSKPQAPPVASSYHNNNSSSNNHHHGSHHHGSHHFSGGHNRGHHGHHERYESRPTQQDHRNAPRQPPFRAFVKSLPYSFDEQDIIRIFREVLNIEVIDCQLDLRPDNTRKGSGYLTFPDRHNLITTLGFRNQKLFNGHMFVAELPKESISANNSSFGSGGGAHNGIGSSGFSRGSNVNNSSFAFGDQWRSSATAINRPGLGSGLPTTSYDSNVSLQRGPPSSSFNSPLNNNMSNGTAQEHQSVRPSFAPQRPVVRSSNPFGQAVDQAKANSCAPIAAVPSAPVEEKTVHDEKENDSAVEKQEDQQKIEDPEASQQQQQQQHQQPAHVVIAPVKPRKISSRISPFGEAKFVDNSEIYISTAAAAATAAAVTNPSSTTSADADADADADANANANANAGAEAAADLPAEEEASTVPVATTDCGTIAEESAPQDDVPLSSSPANAANAEHTGVPTSDSSFEGGESANPDSAAQLAPPRAQRSFVSSKAASTKPRANPFGSAKPCDAKYIDLHPPSPAVQVPVPDTTPETSESFAASYFGRPPADVMAPQMQQATNVATKPYHSSSTTLGSGSSRNGGRGSESSGSKQNGRRPERKSSARRNERNDSPSAQAPQNEVDDQGFRRVQHGRGKKAKAPQPQQRQFQKNQQQQMSQPQPQHSSLASPFEQRA